MPIKSVVELPREFEAEISRPPVAVRRWVCNLTDDALSNPISDPDLVRATATPNLTWGNYHPTWDWLRLRKVTASENYEGDPYKALVTAEYGVITPDEALPPHQRAPVWSSEAGSAEVPVLYYYSGAGNETRLPLTNSAYDYFQGLTTPEAIVRVRVRKNYGIPFNQISPDINSVYPQTQINAINHLNNAAYGGNPAHTYKCTGVTTQLTYEVYGVGVYQYWDTVSELTFRQTGWNLQLPDVGFNFISGGQKRRAMVFDFQNGEWVASPNPVGLDGNGNQTGGAPAILNRRVLPEANFTTIFGAVPS